MLKFLDKIAEWIPGRKESKLKRKEKLKNEMESILRKGDRLSAVDANRYQLLADELHEIEKTIERIG